MFTQKAFHTENNELIFNFIETYAFGTLTSLIKGRFFTTHLPFMLSPDRKSLYAHLALPNPQHLDIEQQEVLVVFHGPHSYISPTWYASEGGVPTWNYQAVHVYGKCKVFRDTKRLEHVVNTLSNKYEKGFEHPWTPDYKPAMLNAIVGLEISIGEVQAKFKLSQNKNQEDIASVISHLEQCGDIELARVMQQHSLSSS